MDSVKRGSQLKWPGAQAEGRAAGPCSDPHEDPGTLEGVDWVNLFTRLNSTTSTEEFHPYKCKREFRINKLGEEVPMTPFLMKCSGCPRYKIIHPSCGLRNCKRCMGRRARKIERKYLPVIMAHPDRPGAKWGLVTLEGIVIKTLDRKIINHFTNTAVHFLKKEYPLAFIGATEHTLRPLQKSLDGQVIEWGLYLHFHALYYGPFKHIYPMARRWREALLDAGLLSYYHDPLGGYHGINLKKVRGGPRGGLRYVLKYVSKGVELSDDAVTLLARLKYIRTAGFLYGTKELTYEPICADCGAKCYPVFDFDPLDYPDPPPERKLVIHLVEKIEVSTA